MRTKIGAIAQLSRAHNGSTFEMGHSVAIQAYALVTDIRIEWIKECVLTEGLECRCRAVEVSGDVSCTLYLHHKLNDDRHNLFKFRCNATILLSGRAA